MYSVYIGPVASLTSIRNCIGPYIDGVSSYHLFYEWNFLFFFSHKCNSVSKYHRQPITHGSRGTTMLGSCSTHTHNMAHLKDRWYMIVTVVYIEGENQSD